MTRRVVRPLARTVLLPITLSATALSACVCDDVNAFLPQGNITPPVLDMGPITTGSTCPARFKIGNTGNADLQTAGVDLTDTNGDFFVKIVPALVRLQAEEELLIDYTAGSEIGARESTNITVNSNDPDDGGKLRATVTAFVAAEPVGLARAECDNDVDASVVDSPCTSRDFGAVIVGDAATPIAQRPGATREVRIVNDGNKDLVVQGALVDGGNGDFAVLSARRGTQLVELPFTVPAGRSGDCGDLTGADNTLVIDVHFAPVNLGAGLATLNVLTDGAEGSLIEVALSGQGADTGLLMNPEIVRFGDVAEGTSATEVVNVANIGTTEAGVTDSCIDVDGDDACDALCTGAADDVALGGTLSCKVKKTDGGREGKGFLLAPTDARAGGDDERNVEITWTPSAADPAIPGTAVLLLKSNILSNTVFKVGIIGGNVGVVDVTSDVACGDNHCMPAVGDAADVTTWTGSLELTIANVGDASVTLGTIAPDAATPATIADDWTIGAPASTTLAPGASTTLTLTYANLDCSVDPCVPEDFAGADGFNLIIEHNGAVGETLVAISVVPPN